MHQHERRYRTTLCERHCDRGFASPYRMLDDATSCLVGVIDGLPLVVHQLVADVVDALHLWVRLGAHALVRPVHLGMLVPDVRHEAGGEAAGLVDERDLSVPSLLTRRCIAVSLHPKPEQGVQPVPLLIRVGLSVDVFHANQRRSPDSPGTYR